MPRCRLYLVIVCLGVLPAIAVGEQHGRSVRLATHSVEVRGDDEASAADSAAPPRDPLNVKLPARNKPAPGSEASPSRRRPPSSTTVISSLAVVVGIFLILVWLSKKAAPKSTQALPAEVVQVLGRAPLAARNVMHLVRVGKKLLLVSLTAQGAATLTEITDPQEVDRLAALCERARPGSISSTFRNVLNQFAEERTVPGFIGREREAERHSA